jgi:hypothetical protein
MSYDRSLKAVNDYKNTVCNKSLQNLESALKGYTGMTEDQTRLYSNIYHYTKGDLAVCKTSNDKIWDPRPLQQKKTVSRENNDIIERLENSIKNPDDWVPTDDQLDMARQNLINFDSDIFLSLSDNDQKKLLYYTAKGFEGPILERKKAQKIVDDFFTMKKAEIQGGRKKRKYKK